MLSTLAQTVASSLTKVNSIAGKLDDPVRLDLAVHMHACPASQSHTSDNTSYTLSKLIEYWTGTSIDSIFYKQCTCGYIAIIDHCYMYVYHAMQHGGFDIGCGQLQMAPYWTDH